MLSRAYVEYLEMLPCNRHARKRSPPVGQWLAGWVPEQRQSSIAEAMQQAFIDGDCRHGVMEKISRANN